MNGNMNDRTGRVVKIMGIVNITPDSFYSGSRNMTPDGKILIDRVVERVADMIEKGAGYIDVGACSTRPGSESVDAENEWKRLKAVLRPIREVVPPGVKISIDTFRRDIIARTLDEIGEVTVNDISAGEDDPMMLGEVAANSLEYIAMHKKGIPSDMQSKCDYGNGVTAAVMDYFREFALKDDRLGIRNWLRFRQDGGAELRAARPPRRISGVRSAHPRRNLPQEHDLQASRSHSGSPRSP